MREGCLQTIFYICWKGTEYATDEDKSLPEQVWAQGRQLHVASVFYVLALLNLPQVSIIYSHRQ